MAQKMTEEQLAKLSEQERKRLERKAKVKKAAKREWKPPFEGAHRGY